MGFLKNTRNKVKEHVQKGTNSELTPTEISTKIVPDFTNIPPWGTPAIVHIPKEKQRNSENRGIKTRYIGESTTHKGKIFLRCEILGEAIVEPSSDEYSNILKLQITFFLSSTPNAEKTTACLRG
jgi:hypothetical protein